MRQSETTSSHNISLALLTSSPTDTQVLQYHIVYVWYAHWKVHLYALFTCARLLPGGVPVTRPVTNTGNPPSWQARATPETRWPRSGVLSLPQPTNREFLLPRDMVKTIPLYDQWSYVSLNYWRTMRNSQFAIRNFSHEYLGACDKTHGQLLKRMSLLVRNMAWLINSRF